MPVKRMISVSFSRSSSGFWISNPIHRKQHCSVGTFLCPRDGASPGIPTQEHGNEEASQPTVIRKCSLDGVKRNPGLKSKVHMAHAPWIALRCIQATLYRSPHL